MDLPWTPEVSFFLSNSRFESCLIREPRQRGAISGAFSNREHGLFHPVDISKKDFWSQGTGMDPSPNVLILVQQIN